MSNTKEDDDIVRGRAKAVVEILARNQAMIDGQLTSSSAWLSGSLFALNGGAAIALSQIVDRVQQPRLSLALLIAGLFFALLSPVIIQFYAAQASPIVGSWILYYAGVAEGAEIDAEIENGFAHQISTLRWMTIASPAVGWVSGILFLSAVGSIAVGFDRDSSANDQRCLQIQRDILSGTPRRSDSIRLFEVFKCKPAGMETMHLP